MLLLNAGYFLVRVRCQEFDGCNGLDAALGALGDLNEKIDVAAINALQAFINATWAQRGQQITETEADELIAKAEEIIDQLST